MHQGIASPNRHKSICKINPELKGMEMTGEQRCFVMGDKKYARQNDGVGHAVAIKRESARHEKGSIGGRRKDCNYAVCLLTLTLSFNAVAGQLDTQIPAYRDDSFLAIMEVNIPAQPLAMSLKQFATSAGLSLAFDSNLGENKMAPAVQGRMSRKEALRRILAGSGLNSELTGSTVVVSKPDSNEAITTEIIPVRAKRFYEVGPLPGLGLTKDQIPGNVQSITAQEIKDSHSLSLTDLMNRKLQSVTVNDYQGNPFQMDLSYRGFTAGPQIGTPQGLAIFFDGIRVNEPFGDVVNWDMIPMNALAGLDVIPGSNPIYGLGALGGALSMRTKDGFNDPGVDAEVLTGSFGRKQLQASGGWNNGTVGLFGAGNFFLEDGWRDNSPSRVNQAFGKASYRGEKLDLNLSTLLVKTDLVGNGLLPSEMYAQDPTSVFTSPDTTENTLVQFQLSGSYFVSDNFSVTAQAYKRMSRRHQVGSDVFTEFEDQVVRRDLAPGEEYTCLFENSADNKYGLPDYYVVKVPGLDYENGIDYGLMPPEIYEFVGFGALPPPATLDEAFSRLPDSWKNADLPSSYVDFARASWLEFQNFAHSNLFTPNGEPLYPSPQPVPGYSFDVHGGLPVFYNPSDDAVGADLLFSTGLFQFTFVDENGVPSFLILKPAINGDKCTGSIDSQDLEVPGPSGGVQTVDGAAYNLTNPGVVTGTPTAVITDNQIDQETDGASIQFNWNFEKHKFMIGLSIDAPSATYESSQRLGMLDAQRNAFLAPELIRDQYAAADTEISNNDFEGSQVTKSIYASETWSPIDTLHITGAMRYNETKGKNEIAGRLRGYTTWGLHELRASPNAYDICRPGEKCPTGYIVPDVSRVLLDAEKEKFSYYSLNPSLGVSWQANPSLNLFGNIARGTRTPSVIELGCAFDHTPVTVNGNETLPRSLAENRFCTLPNTLSGDPYLPQIKATTLDLGMRGRWGENIQWNVGLYRTDLKDDIYMIGYPGNKNFFDTIGKTRRQGFEGGIIGTTGKWEFGLNYALTEATFQDTFLMPANDNSSSVEDFRGNHEFSRLIEVEPGDRMPGVPLHNLNATVTYNVTPKWRVGLSAVAHSMAYVRGNENNEHRPGQSFSDSVKSPNGPGFIQLPRRLSKNSGTVDGYMVFNLQTSYQVAPEWRLSLLVNNIFDKEYFSAGRLGVNPFSPSIYGAIGSSGYNHNSTDWLTTNFLAPGAPRAAWVSLSYEFKPDR